jgi:hypothetical protein
MMGKLYDFINKKRKIVWVATLVYIVINSCFMFPSLNIMIKTKTIDYSFSYVIVIGYSMIALILTGLLKEKPIKVFFLTLFFTAIGLGCRYALEFGEVSNMVNFTGINVLIFLITIPLFVMLVYLIIPKIELDKSAK